MRLLASALVIVGDGFAPSLILWPEAFANEIATASVNGSNSLFIGQFITLQCYCARGDESRLPWLHGRDLCRQKFRQCREANCMTNDNFPAPLWIPLRRDHPAITCRNGSPSKSYWTKTRQGIKLVNALSEESVGQSEDGLEATQRQIHP